MKEIREQQKRIRYKWEFIRRFSQIGQFGSFGVGVGIGIGIVLSADFRRLAQMFIRVYESELLKNWFFIIAIAIAIVIKIGFLTSEFIRTFSRMVSLGPSVSVSVLFYPQISQIGADVYRVHKSEPFWFWLEFFVIAIDT